MEGLSELSLLIIAQDERTPAEDLALLIAAASPAVLSAVAANPSTSPQTLALLAERRREGAVAHHLMHNKNTPQETLLSLLHGDFYPMGLRVSEHLSKHKNPLVRVAVTSSRFTRREVLKAMASRDTLSQVRTAAVTALDEGTTRAAGR